MLRCVIVYTSVCITEKLKPFEKTALLARVALFAIPASRLEQGDRVRSRHVRLDVMVGPADVPARKAPLWVA
jgi:hypothetical protein